MDAELHPRPDAPANAEEVIARLIEVLDELGFAPERRVVDGEQQVGLRHCPFLELAENRSSVVCPVHLGLMQERWKPGAHRSRWTGSTRSWSRTCVWLT